MTRAFAVFVPAFIGDSSERRCRTHSRRWFGIQSTYWILYSHIQLAGVPDRSVGLLPGAAGWG